MATVKELQERISTLEAAIEVDTQSLSKVSKAKRDKEKQIAAIKDEMLDALQAELTQNRKTK